MQKMIGINELQEQFRTVLDEVINKEASYVLLESNLPEAAIIPYQDYLRLLSFQEQAILDRFDRLLGRLSTENAEYTEDDIARDIEVAREERTT